MMAANWSSSTLDSSDTNPSGDADIRRSEVGIGRLLDQSCLHAGSGSDPHRDVPVAVVIIRKHGEDTLRREECGLAVRSLFDCARNRAADKANPLELRAIVPCTSRPLGGESALFSHLTIFGYPKAIYARKPNHLGTSAATMRDKMGL